MNTFKAILWGVLLWAVITFAGMLSYVYVGLRCADGISCVLPK